MEPNHHRPKGGYAWESWGGRRNICGDLPFLCGQRPAPTGTASRSCSRESAQSNKDEVAGWALRLRPLGLTGSSAMNSAQEKSDCCDFVPRTRRRNTPSFAPGQAVADTCGRTQSRAAFSDSRPNHSDPFTPFSQSEKLVTDTLSNGYAASPTLGERSRLALSCSLELGDLLVQLFLGRRQLRNLPLQLRDQPHQLVALRGREVLDLTHSQSIKLVQYPTTPLPTPIPLINYQLTLYWRAIVDLRAISQYTTNSVPETLTQFVRCLPEDVVVLSRIQMQTLH